MGHKGYRGRRLLMTIIGGSLVALLVAAGRPVQAQPTTAGCGQVTQDTSDDALIDSAICVYNKSDWVLAAMYFESYWLRKPDLAAQNQAFRKQLLAGLQYAQSQATAAVIEYQKQGGVTSAGVSGHALRIMPPIVIKVPSEAPPSYPLVCRGGGELMFEFLSNTDLSSNPQVRISFERSSSGVGLQRENLQMLQPGQCAWQDRPVGNGEPSRAVITEPLFNSSDFAVTWNPEGMLGVDPKLSYISALQSPYGVQTFDVYNDGHGNFVVTKIEGAP